MFDRVLVLRALIVGSVVGVLPIAHRHVDAWAPSEAAVDDIRFLPSGDLLATVSLGYEPVFADLLWIWATMLFGERIGQGEDDRWLGWLYHITDMATDLDPRFARAYKYGGIMLRVSPDFVEPSSLIFAKGMHHVPQEYYLPFGVAMNYYLHHDNQEVAADYMLQASKLPGAPFFTRNLAASMLRESNRTDVALQFLEEEFRSLPDGSAKKAVEVKIAELRYRSAADAAREVLLKWKDEHGALPDSPEGPGRVLPRDPLGGHWQWLRSADAREADVASDREEQFFADLAATSGLGERVVKEQRRTADR